MTFWHKTYKNWTTKKICGKSSSKGLKKPSEQNLKRWKTKSLVTNRRNLFSSMYSPKCWTLLWKRVMRRCTRCTSNMNSWKVPFIARRTSFIQLRLLWIRFSLLWVSKSSTLRSRSQSCLKDPISELAPINSSSTNPKVCSMKTFGKKRSKYLISCNTLTN